MPATGTFESSEHQLEAVLNAALGRQMRVMALFGCVLTVGGFVLGHYVAAVQARVVSERLESRIGELQHEITHLGGRCDRQEAESERTLSALAEVQRLRQAEARQDKETLSALINDVEHRAAESLKQVEPYVTRRLYLPPQQVKQLVHRFVDEQVKQMSLLLEIQERRIGPAVKMAEQAPSRAAPAPSVTGGYAAVPAPPPADNGAPWMTVEAPEPLADVEPAPTREPAAAPLTQVAPKGPAAIPYVSPPPRRGLLFFSPSQPGRLDPERVSGSDAIPLPPR